MSDGVTIRPSRGPEEILAAGRLRYHIYVRTKPLGHPEHMDLENLRSSLLSRLENATEVDVPELRRRLEQVESWVRDECIIDDYDLAPQTTHFMAFSGSRDLECIGHVRTIDKDNPMARDVPEYAAEVIARHRHFREISKLMIHPDYRGKRSGILAGLFRFVFHHAKEVDHIYVSCLPELRGLYEKIMMLEHGPRFKHAEFGTEYLIMRGSIHAALRGEWQDKVRYPKLSAYWLRALMLPIPATPIENLYLLLGKGVLVLSFLFGRYFGIRF